MSSIPNTGRGVNSAIETTQAPWAAGAPTGTGAAPPGPEAAPAPAGVAEPEPNPVIAAALTANPAVGPFADLYADPVGSPGPAAPAPGGTPLFGAEFPLQMAPNQVKGIGNASKLVGAELGKIPGTNDAVMVKREIGSTAGYDDRLKAIAIARMGKADPSAVLQTADGKWHAVETSAGFHGKTLDGQKAGQNLYGLPSNADLAADKAKITELEAKLGRIKGLEGEWAGDNSQNGKTALQGLKSARETTEKELIKARETHDSHVLGLKPDEVHFTAYPSGRVYDKVNIIGTPGRGSTGGAHGPLNHQEGGTTFRPGMRTASSIDRDKLTDPAAAARTLFHETAHRKDYEFAQKWAVEFKKTHSDMWFEAPHGVKVFRDWITSKVPAELTAADARLVSDVAFDDTATTEARANLQTFTAALQAGDGPAAVKLLEAYALALGPRKEYATPAEPGRNEVVAALTKELKAVYQQLPKDMRGHFDAAFDAAKSANKGAWFVDMKYK